jgi:hypothetical protein
MRPSFARLASLLALALATATFAGAAAANGGGDHGNGGGDHATSPGEQQKQDNGSGQSSSSSQSKSGDQPGDSKKSQPSSQAGVKPSNSTDKWTKTNVGAKPDVSKRYGNGSTAAEIAKSRGANDNVQLSGPGNSQPHKVCGRDVHAVKSYNADGTCGAKVELQKQESGCNESCGAVKSEQKVVQPEQKVVKVEAQKPVVANCGEAVVTVPGGVLHKTGNGDYVLIHPSESSAHYQGKHEDDVVLADKQVVVTNGEACAAVQATKATEQVSACAPVTTTKDVSFRVVDGVWHKTGNGDYVLIHPSASSAHYQGKHGDDIANVVTVTKTVLVTATPETCATQAPGAPVNAAQSNATQSNATQGKAAAPVVAVKAATVSQTAPGSVQGTSAQAASAPVSVGTPQGGVAGAQATLNQPKPSRGGVLGAVGNLAGASLPFTGFPLWIAVLLAVALVAGGLTLSRRGRGDARL